eukprot:Nk52_evm9s161 gene=Nk52_evmTU9s161
MSRLWLLLGALLVLGRAQASDLCASTHMRVGFSAELESVSAGVEGTLTIINDCTFRVTEFGYDGHGEAMWWAAQDLKSLAKGIPMEEGRGTILQGYGKRTIYVQLPEGSTWDNVGVLSIWNQKYKVPLAGVVLGQGDKGGVVLPGFTLTYENCQTLQKDVLNLHWTINSNTNRVDFGLEAHLPTTQYISFGFPSGKFNSMIGGDVTLAGYIGNVSFAKDLYLGSYSECNASDGVCVEKGKDDQKVKLEGWELANGVMHVKYSKDLSSIPSLTEPVYILWAYGDLDLKSTVDYPIAKYHFENRVSPGETIHFGEPSYSCQPLVSKSKPLSDTKLLSNTQTFNVTVGYGSKYGVSFYINGEETPMLNVSQGIEYIFSVQAGHLFPLYITTSDSGGRVEDETIFAGSMFSFGTAASPYVLKWTPPSNSPKILYYQCPLFKHLGWKVNVQNSVVLEKKEDGSSVTLQKKKDKGLVRLEKKGNTKSAVKEQKEKNHVVNRNETKACSYRFAGQLLEFTFCQSIYGSYVLHWSSNGTHVEILASVDNARGWVSFAVASTAGLMDGAFAVLGWVGTDGGKNIKTYRLGNDRIAERIDIQKVTNMDVEENSKGTAIRFIMAYKEGENKGPMNALAAHSHSKGLFAHSPSDRTGFSFSIEKDGITSSAHTRSLKVTAHIVLMVLGWGVLLPIGIIFAALLKRTRKPLFFRLHVGAQIIGISAVLAGFGLALDFGSGSEEAHSHRAMGYMAVFCMCLQLVAFIFRPKPNDSIRVYWNIAHKTVGLSSILIAWANVFEGFHLLRNSSTIMIFLWIACIVCVLGGYLISKELFALQKVNWNNEEEDDTLLSLESEFGQDEDDDLVYDNLSTSE